MDRASELHRAWLEGRLPWEDTEPAPRRTGILATSGPYTRTREPQRLIGTCRTCREWRSKETCARLPGNTESHDLAWSHAFCECGSTFPTTIHTGADFGCVHWRDKQVA